TLAQNKFQVYLQNTLAKLFKTVSNELLGNVTNNEFKM
ncbi:nucleotidyl transferase AbiEii/AbiGii toxin family protein, partial [Vibrio anguillarum]|nr:nucleotidyl transferase AbiEii/AbiGii toxin family protein [Vibrio anguillarum]